MISVIIPSHNNLTTLKKAVSSVLEQTYRNFEIIIIDNGSDESFSKEELIDTEHLKEVLGENEISQLNDKVILLQVPESLGAAAARNKGLEMAKGEYIAFLDADDYWAEDKLDKQLKVMEKFSVNGDKPLICFTGRQIIDTDGNDTGRYVGCSKVVDYKKLLKTNQINCSSVMMRAEIAKKNPFPDLDGFHEDYAVWLTILKEGGYAAGINRPLLYYRRSPKSKSGNKINSAVMTYRVYKYMNIGYPKRIACFISYAINGFKKTYG